MSEGTAVNTQRRRTGRCQHHWIIESPHGVTSRGRCKVCGLTRRFPNAAEDALWESGGSALGRWANRRASGPTEVKLPNRKT